MPAKNRRNIILGVIIVLIVGVILGTYFFKGEENLLGKENCDNLLSIEEIKSICDLTGKESSSLEKNSVYWNKFDDPFYTVWDDGEKPYFIEKCIDAFTIGYSEIYFDMWIFSEKDQALSNYYASINEGRENLFRDKQEQIEKLNSLGDAAQYSKGNVFQMSDTGENLEIVGNQQNIFWAKDKTTIYLEERPWTGESFICSKEQMIELAKLVESKI